MAAIEQRKTKDGKISYRVKIRIKGRPAQTATFERKTDAKRWVQDTESKIREGKYFHTAEARRHTVAEMIGRYARVEMSVRGTTSSSLGQTYCCFNREPHFLCSILKRTPAELSPDE